MTFKTSLSKGLKPVFLRASMDIVGKEGQLNIDFFFNGKELLFSFTFQKRQEKMTGHTHWF